MLVNMSRMGRRKFILIVAASILVIFIIFIIFLILSRSNMFVPKPVEYKNSEYGFSIVLPDSWKGYRVIESKWLGYEIDTPSDIPTDQGPIIQIRHPNWKEDDPYQDIPIMVFTLEQWKVIQDEKLSVSAAPFPPTELARNSIYVLALPARYNYSFYKGWQEVETIIKSGALKAFEPSG